MHETGKTYLYSILVVAVAFGVTAAASARPNRAKVGAVFTMTNSALGNEVLGWARHPDGSLSYEGSWDTEGLGTGAGLGNQGGVVLSEDGRFLLVVNAGSDQISAFAVHGAELMLASTVSSQGVRPVSVTAHGGLVYVVNAGGAEGDADSIAGFTLSAAGELAPLAGSTRALSATSTGPAQIAFSPDGKVLAVSEKATNRVTTYTIDGDGYASDPIANAAAGTTPFAIAFARRDLLVVSEVFGGAEDAGAVSTYRVGRNGGLSVIDASVPNTETAPCWLVVTKGGKYAFTTNTPDDSLSAYGLDAKGDLTLLDADGRAAEPGEGTSPLDMDLSNDGRFLYTLNIGNGTIGTFRVGPHGSLEYLGSIGGVPSGVNGLAAQ